MALAGLVTMKCGYMGGASGPPVVRHVDIPSLRLIISNNDIQRKVKYYHSINYKTNNESHANYTRSV